ncbi:MULTISPECIES: ABC transporter permease [unclassified Luteococcus]|uniref:ABC transporter permease n=1 Tax=unclassified Luteococcus TaxID=2639923 RepID=UPI00313C097F
MNFIRAAFAWLADPANLHGPDGWPTHLLEHLGYTLLTVALAAAVAIPLGYLVGHTGRGRNLAVGSSGAARALPSLGLVTLLGLWLGVGLQAPLVALVLLAIPSVLAGAYAGIEAVNPVTVDAARAQGMTEWQVLRQVEIPLGLPLLVGGLRSATLQVVSTATLAAYVGAGGLGRDLFLGLKTQDYPQMLAASLLVVGLAIALELTFELTERALRRARPIPEPREMT